MITPHSRISASAPQRMARCLLAAMLGWLVHCSLVSQAFAETPSAPLPRTKEFFTQQPADTPLVIRMEAFETEMESRVFDPKDILLRASGIPSQRLGALYQFIEATDKPRQLRIEVTLGHSTDRSRLDMRVTKFEPDGPDRTGQIKAYRLLSAGLELQTSRTADAWTMKVITLMQAANFFDLLGMQELQLWSAFYAHYYLLYVLNDAMTAAEGAREIQAAAQRSGLNELALAALQLQGSAVAAQVTGKDGDTANRLYAQAQDLFSGAAELAGRLDLQHEQALAIYHSGLAYESASEHPQAFSQFDQAVAVAAGCGDTALANQVRQHAAELHESLGQNTQAIELLQKISAETPDSAAAATVDTAEADVAEGNQRADREMMAYLFEQGRLLEKTYRHSEAADVLRQALQLDRKSPTPRLAGPAGLLLGKALYGAGQMDTALLQLQESVQKTAAVGNEQALAEALGIIAAIQRGIGDFAAMANARERQGMFITEAQPQAEFAFEQGLDKLAAEGPESAAARALLRQSAKQARESGAGILAGLAGMQLCALGEADAGGGTSCSADAMQAVLAALEATGLPIPTQQARLLWVRILQRQGQDARALSELDRLIEDMHFWHSNLPGVLGAWYWQNREAVFRAYMQRVIGQAGPVAGGKLVDIQSLAALDRLMRYWQQPASATAAADSPANQQLRSLIAGREEMPSPQEATKLSRDILSLAQQGKAGAASLKQSGAALTRQLAGLNSDESLLSYYFSTDKVYAWVGRKDGLRLFAMPWSASQAEALARDLEGLRQAAANGKPADFAGAMDHWGRVLLAPVAAELARVVYFFPTGLAQGLPLDALRSGGEYLATRCSVVNLVSLQALGRQPPRVEKALLQRLFLAGNRQDVAGDFARSRPASAELAAIADMFVGPGLHIVQGAALQWDEFQDQRFTGAGVVHLAMPGIVDVRQPAQSRLLLSDNAENPEHTFLRPQDIGRQAIGAALLVLSASSFDGANPSAFGHDPSLVADFLRAGAGSVMASLWRVGDAEAARFMQAFYRHLLQQQDAGAALLAAKRGYLADPARADRGAWAAFQLWVD